MDIQPNVKFRPVGQRENADALALVDPGVEDIPKFGTLVFGIPLAVNVAEGINTLLGARFFLVAARSAKRCRKSTHSQRVEQSPGFQQTATFLCTKRKRACPRTKSFPVLMHDEFGA